jgi:hypothetical protein
MKTVFYKQFNRGFCNLASSSIDELGIFDLGRDVICAAGFLHERSSVCRLRSGAAIAGDDLRNPSERSFKFLAYRPNYCQGFPQNSAIT